MNVSTLEKIIEIVRQFSSHDFSLYKRSTIRRRIDRRMVDLQLDHVEKYVQRLEEDRHEVKALVRSILIGVTRFFRDPEVFDYLKNVIFTRLLEENRNDGHLRIWVPGCSSGEEAYSIAIVFHEIISQKNSNVTLQIFATDVDEQAIGLARKGKFSPSIAEHVSGERLNRYFSKTESGFKIAKLVRTMLVFAVQNLISDPPFTNIDVLSCRNLMIYFQPELQDKLLKTMHYSLSNDGILVLGQSESIGRNDNLFDPTNKTSKVHRKRQSPNLRDFSRSPFSISTPEFPTPEIKMQPHKNEEVIHFIEAILKQSSLPPSAIIDDQSNIVYIHGRVGEFLEPPEGQPSMSILNMARTGLKSELATAIPAVRKSGAEYTKKNLQVFANRPITINLTITPVCEDISTKGLLIVAFEKIKETEDVVSADEVTKESPRAVALVQEELRETREKLRALVEELQSSNEELKSSNEELQSTNEELQSTNEELETSKEELQSLHEEATTVNSELQSRNEQLSKTSDDMKNLLDSTDIAALFLDADLSVRNYTPRMVDIIPLDEVDKRKPISKFSTSLIGNVDLKTFSQRILDDLKIREVEVETNDGSVYLLRGRPYKTLDNVIDGVVLTFENVTQMQMTKQTVSTDRLFDVEQRLSALLSVHNEGVAITDLTGAIQVSNKAFSKITGHSEFELAAMNILDLSPPNSEDPTRDQINRYQRGAGDLTKSVRFEQVYVRKDKSHVSCSVNLMFYHDTSGQHKGQLIAFVVPN